MKGARKLSVVAALLAAMAAPAFAQADPAKPGQDKPQTPDEIARRQIEENYRALLAGADVKVSMDFRTAKVQEIVAEFRRQVRNMNFDLVATNIPEEYRVEEFVVRGEHWRSALEAFAKKAELTVEDLSPTLIRLNRPPRVTFAFKDADVKTVIDLIARMSGANIIMNTGGQTGIKGTITMSVNNVPWPQVLAAVVKTLGYTTVREDYDIIRVVTPQELLKQIENRVFKLKYITAPEPYRARIEESKQIKGTGTTPPVSVEDIDKQFFFLTLIRGSLTRDANNAIIGRMNFDPKAMCIVVNDTRVALDTIEKIIQVLDVEPPQVMIDLKYISTINEDLLTFGVNYSLAGQDGLGITTKLIPPVRSDAATTTAGTNTFSPFTTGGSGLLTRLPFGLGGTPFDQKHYFFSQYDMSAAFRAFKRDRFSRLLQEPSLTVVDNTEATIFVGENIPYAESRAITTATGAVTLTIGEGAKSPVRVGFQLLVIPHIIKETNRVLLTVIPSNEFLSGQSTNSTTPAGFDHFFLQGGAGGSDASIDLPRVANSTLVTRLMVENGRTVVIGGLKTERSVYEDKKVPFLGDLPLIDFLFKQRNDSVRKESLLIFLTPRIIASSNALTEDTQRLVRETEERSRKEIEELKARRRAEDVKKADEQKMQDAASELEKIRQGVK